MAYMKFRGENYLPTCGSFFYQKINMMISLIDNNKKAYLNCLFKYLCWHEVFREALMNFFYLVPHASTLKIYLKSMHLRSKKIISFTGTQLSSGSSISGAIGKYKSASLSSSSSSA